MSDDVIQVQSDSDPRPPVSPPAPEIFIVKSEKSGMYALVVSGDGQTRLCRGTDATHLRRRVISCLTGEYRLPMEMAQGLAGEVPELADQPESPREERGGGDQLRHQPHASADDDHPPPTDQESHSKGEDEQDATVAVTGPRLDEDQASLPRHRRGRMDNPSDMAFPAPSPQGQHHHGNDEPLPGKEA
jgi:hypothetical protein